MIKYEIKMFAFCDGCGASLESGFADKLKSADVVRWDWQSKWRAMGMVIRHRKYGQNLIYCNACSDGNPKHRRGKR